MDRNPVFEDDGNTGLTATESKALCEFFRDYSRLYSQGPVLSFTIDHDRDNRTPGSAERETTSQGTPIMRIVQMTSVHDWRDARVFLKMCAGVASAGHEVHLVVPRDTVGVETIDGVVIHGLPRPANRRDRMFGTIGRVLETAAGLKGDIYQFHDPEFLLRAPGFQDRVGVPVIFDSHEDYRLQMQYKIWLPKWSRRSVGHAVGLIEDRTVNRLAGVIAATPSIAERFRHHPACVVVQNFPVLEELRVPESECGQREVGRFGYVGGLSVVRGAEQMIDALPVAGKDVRLDLGGPWTPPSLREACAAKQGWQQVDELGYMNRDQIATMFRRVFAGLSLLHPTPSYLTAYSVKMFEYMAGGLPFIASDFPMWRGIVDDAECGLLANPLDPVAIGKAMRQLTDDPDAAMRMGENGRRAVEEKYNWGREQEKLLTFYGTLVD
jgi:glycosyltransferase involved in cell wall biosynthesis